MKSIFLNINIVYSCMQLWPNVLKRVRKYTHSYVWNDANSNIYDVIELHSECMRLYRESVHNDVIKINMINVKGNE